MKIDATPPLRVAEAGRVPHRSLLGEAPLAVVGAARNPPMVTAGIRPNANTCFGPRGCALIYEKGPFWVSDTGHHRLLGWKSTPTQDGTPADWIIGQKDFYSEGRNGKAKISAASLNVPTGICASAGGMAVADAWNHRILIWKRCPDDSNVPADIVLGQADFHSGESNRGSNRAAANTFHWPYGVAWFDHCLLVADSENRRVLIWRGLPEHNGQSADIVLGQHDMDSRDENAGGNIIAMSMRWPHGIAFWQGHLCVSDAGNNRIMVWKGIPNRHGAECDFILGQTSSQSVDHNQSLYWPRDNTLNMPYGIAAHGDWLLVADTANSRLLGWHLDDLATGAPARALSGQLSFHDKGDNRWQPAVADSFCWPYGLHACGDCLAVADSGNNRVSLWRIAV
ncbi:MAG: hypothetical protein ACU843_16660 [Gammaproteobacteria bacterium]